MRPIWNGTISFGLVNIPVSLVSAEDPSELDLFMMDSRDNARISYQRVNVDTGKEVPWEDIVKAYEFADGSYVIVEDDDYVQADPKASKTLEIEEFVPAGQVDPRYLEKPYYIIPAKGSEKAYALLREAMKKAGRAAIGRVTLRTKQSLALIVPLKDALVMIRLRYDEEVRSIEKLDLPEGTAVSDREMKLALTLIDELAEDWDPSGFHDGYTAALLKRLEDKAHQKGKEPTEEAPSEEEDSNVVDILELLRKSVDNRTARNKAVGEEGEASSAPKKRSSVKTQTKRKST